MQQLLRVQNFSVSADGYGAGEDQSLDRPFGHADPSDLVAWAAATASWPNRTEPGGSRGLDDYLTRDFSRNIGAEIMGRNKFGPQRGPWSDHDWLGWWGDEPPFHTPVFVLTHHLRPSFTLADTTFHFAIGDPADVLARARAAADGQDVRLGGGAQTIRFFLDADLVDTLHVAVSPVELGSGSGLWQSPDELDDRFLPRRSPQPQRSGPPPALDTMTSLPAPLDLIYFHQRPDDRTAYGQRSGRSACPADGRCSPQADPLTAMGRRRLEHGRRA